MHERIPKLFSVPGVYFAGVGDEEKSAEVDLSAVSHRLQCLMLQRDFSLRGIFAKPDKTPDKGIKLPDNSSCLAVWESNSALLPTSAAAIGDLQGANK